MCVNKSKCEVLHHCFVCLSERMAHLIAWVWGRSTCVYQKFERFCSKLELFSLNISITFNSKQTQNNRTTSWCWIRIEALQICMFIPKPHLHWSSITCGHLVLAWQLAFKSHLACRPILAAVIMLMCVGVALRHSLFSIIRLYMALGVTKVTAARSLCDYWLGELGTTSPVCE